MDTRRHPTTNHKTPGHAPSRGLSLVRLVPLLVFGIAIALTGCSAPSSETTFHGQQQLMAVYTLGSLHTTVPPDVPVHSVIAAAEMAVERRGYTVTSSDATDDKGHVVARPRDGRGISKVSITARLVDDGTGISIRTYPGGHEHASRDILERMLTRLGL
jgi:hypothetical protein